MHLTSIQENEDFTLYAVRIYPELIPPIFKKVDEKLFSIGELQRVEFLWKRYLELSW